MKLSFSFAKSAPTKRTIVVPQPVPDEPQRRQVLGVSEDGKLVIEKTAEDIEAEKAGTFVIPCKSHFVRAKRDPNTKPITHDDQLRKLENKSGIITGDTAVNPLNSQPAPKKKRVSILMQIRESRIRGEVKDAPDQETRTFDPEDFGWALLRGMGYDESQDEGLKHDVTKDVVGNRSKLGLGVKLESIQLPTEKRN